MSLHGVTRLRTRCLASLLALVAASACDRAPDAAASAPASCAVPLAAPAGWPRDTISPASRCAMLRLAIARLAAIRDSTASSFAAGDTARIVGAQVFDFPEIVIATGDTIVWRNIEVDIAGRARLFAVRQDRRRGTIEAGPAHR